MSEETHPIQLVFLGRTNRMADRLNEVPRCTVTGGECGEEFERRAILCCPGNTCEYDHEK